MAGLSNVGLEAIAPPLPDIEFVHDNHDRGVDVVEKRIDHEALPWLARVSLLTLLIKLIVPDFNAHLKAPFDIA